MNTPFDDDTHTFTDGPMQRFFRMRKWMFLASAALMISGEGWFDYGRFSKLLLVGAMPQPVVHGMLTAFVLYLCIQSTLVLLQIVFLYRSSLFERTGRVGADAVERADKRKETARQTLNRVIVAVPRTDQEGEDISAKVGALHEVLRIRDLNSERVQALVLEFPDELKSFASEYGRAAIDLRKTISASKERRAIVVTSELGLDFIRIVPAMLFLFGAMDHYGTVAGLTNLFVRP